LTPFAGLYSKTGAMITAVDLLRGLATLLGWKRIEVPGATGYTDTDYAAKLQGAAAALAEVGLTAMRMEVQRTAAGAIVLNDSYNANPTSVRAALDALADLPATRRIAVLGLMAEISDPEAEHRAILEYARGRGIEVLAVGTELYGIEPTDDPVAALGSLAGGDAVLVKASRVVGLERVAAALLG